MMRTTTVLIVAGLAVAAGACTESKRARNAATWGDQPADITCWTYGTETFSGRSTGKVEHSDGGRVAFVDAANGRYTTVDGEKCLMSRGDLILTPTGLWHEHGHEGDARRPEGAPVLLASVRHTAASRGRGLGSPLRGAEAEHG